MDLILAVLLLRASLMDQLRGAMATLAAVVAERTGRSPTDLDVRTAVGAVLGVALSVFFAAADDPDVDVAALMAEAMTRFEGGLPL